MPRHFFYSVRLFAGGFPFAVARIVFESQNTGVEPRNTLSTFFRVHSCAFVIQKNTLSTYFSCSFVVLTLPLLSFSCVSCFSWLNPSFPIRVHSCPFVVLTLLLLSLSCVSCFSWFHSCISWSIRVHSWFLLSSCYLFRVFRVFRGSKHTPSTFFRGSCRPFQFFRA